MQKTKGITKLRIRKFGVETQQGHLKLLQGLGEKMTGELPTSTEQHHDHALG